MKPEYLELYAQVNLAHRNLVTKCVELEHSIKQTADLNELADLSYVLRESYAHADESRKELDRISKLAAKIFYVIWANDPNTPEHIKTKWCTCTPDPKQHAREPSPSKDPEGYRAVMKAIGVPDELIATGLIRIGFQEFGEFLTARQRQGLPMPEGIDPNKVFTEYKVSIKKRASLPTGASGSSIQTDSVEGEDDDGEGNETEHGLDNLGKEGLGDGAGVF